MTRFLRLVCPVMSVSLLASGYYLGGWKWPAVGLFVFWMIGLIIHWAWVPPGGLFVACVAASMGLFLDLSPLLLIPSAIFALLAWDLAGFQDRLSMASPDDDVITLEKRHLFRLSVLALGGIGLSGLALYLHFKFPFEWTVILVFFTVWVIGRVAGLLMKKEQ
jgi:hypothetical protein